MSTYDLMKSMAVESTERKPTFWYTLCPSCCIGIQE